ncbi:tetratricopeptide repeat protein [Candidatus Riflebacteria bacterium]
MEDFLSIHHQLRLFYLKDIRFSNIRERRRSVLQQFSIYHDELISNDRKEALIFSFDELLDLILFPGSEIQVNNGNIILKKGSIFLRSLHTKTDTLLINGVRTKIFPFSVCFIQLQAERLPEFLCLKGKIEVNTKLINKFELTFGRGVRRVGKKKYLNFSRLFNSSVSHFQAVGKHDFSDDIQTEIFAEFKASNYKMALFYAWWYREFFGPLPKDRGLYITANRLLLEKINSGSRDPGVFVAEAILNYLIDLPKKAVQYIVRARRLNRREKSLNFFLAYFRSAAGLGTAKIKLKKYLNKKYPFFSVMLLIKNIKKGSFHPLMLQVFPEKLNTDPALKSIFGRPSAVIFNMIKEKFAEILYPRFLKAWFFNRPEQALTIGLHLKAIFPDNFQLRKNLSRIYLETQDVKKALVEWRQMKSVVSEEEYFYFLYSADLFRGYFLSARKYLQILLKDHFKTLWWMRSLVMASFLNDRSEFEGLLKRVTQPITLPMLRYLQLKDILAVRDKKKLLRILPSFKMERKSEVFQLLAGVNHFLLKNKLKSVQILNNLRRTARLKEIKFLTEHLVDSFLENKVEEVERVMLQIDLHSRGVFSD